MLTYPEFQKACTVAIDYNLDLPKIEDCDHDVQTRFYQELSERGIDTDEAPDKWQEFCEQSVIPFSGSDECNRLADRVEEIRNLENPKVVMGRVVA